MSNEDAGLIDQTVRRWQALDRLLPGPAATRPSCDFRLTVDGPRGQPQAAGQCEHWEGQPGSLDLTWGAARRFQLTTWIAGSDVSGALDMLLSRWRMHLAGLPAEHAADTAAVVHWPSRDVAGVAPLLRRGFAPLAVIAARVADVDGIEPAGQLPPEVQIRRAGPADIDALVALGMEVIRFDAHFGGVTERPSTAQSLTQDLSALLTGPAPWMWLAERDAAPIGMLAAEPPQQARWIATMARPAPLAYLLLMGVRADERAKGVGAALAAYSLPCSGMGRACHAAASDLVVKAQKAAAVQSTASHSRQGSERNGEQKAHGPDLSCDDVARMVRDLAGGPDVTATIHRHADERVTVAVYGSRARESETARKMCRKAVG